MHEERRVAVYSLRDVIAAGDSRIVRGEPSKANIRLTSVISGGHTQTFMVVHDLTAVDEHEELRYRLQIAGEGFPLEGLRHVPMCIELRKSWRLSLEIENHDCSCHPFHLTFLGEVL